MASQSVMMNDQLHFINHPVFGKVYPVVCYDKQFVKNRQKQISLAGLTVTNALGVYSLLIEPFLQGTILTLFVNPLFLFPSILFNSYLYQRNKIYFYAQRSMVINMFLKPSGK